MIDRPINNPARRPAWKFSLILGTIAAVGTAASLQAMPPESGGVAVSSIPGADAITGWNQIDKQRVLVSFSEHDSYLLTLKHQCHGLAWAENVTITMSNNTVWAGFDAINADGEACPIDHIEKMNPKAVLELKAN